MLKKWIKTNIVILWIIISLVALASCNGSEEETGPPVSEEVQDEAFEEGRKEGELEGTIEAEEPERLERPERTQDLTEEERGNQGLIGFWLWSEGSAVYLYAFEEDGTGTRGFICNGVDPNDLPEEEDFQWTASDGILTLHVEGANTELWRYEVSDEILTLTSEQIAGLEYTYARLFGEEDEERYDVLVGVWAWEEEEDWLYVFEFDGYPRGSRPAFPSGREAFDWVLTADDGLLIVVEGGLVEVWSFVIQDDILTLTSRQVAGKEYRYILYSDNEDG